MNCKNFQRKFLIFSDPKKKFQNTQLSRLRGAVKLLADQSNGINFEFIECETIKVHTESNVLILCFMFRLF